MGLGLTKIKSFDYDIDYAKNGFLKQKLFFVIDQTFTIKHFP